MDRKIVIHLGLHKTATTTLQEMVFPSLNEWVYLSRNSLEKNKFINKIYEYIILGKSCSTKELTESLSDIDGNIIISEEWFLSSLDPLMRSASLNWREKALKISELVRVLSCCATVEPVIVLRSPKECLKSYYAEMLAEYGEGQVGSPEKFMVNYGDIFLYHDSIEFIKKILPSTRLIIFDKKNIERYVSDWEALLDCRITEFNKSNSKLGNNEFIYVEKKSALVRGYLNCKICRKLLFFMKKNNCFNKFTRIILVRFGKNNKAVKVGKFNKLAVLDQSELYFQEKL